MQQHCSDFVPQLNEAQARRKISEGSSKKPVLIKFFSPNCGYCSEVEPKVREAAGHLCSDAEVVSVNVDLAPKLAQELKVEGLPTVMLFKDGKPVKKSVGVNTAEHFVGMVGGRKRKK